MANEQDKVVQGLFDIVQEKKAEIEKAEKPNWITNSNFSYEDGLNNRFNIQTVNNTDVLVEALAFLIRVENSYDEANEQLGLESGFKWKGYTVEQWKTDFKTRINKINIKNKKAELEQLESRLDKLVSPELKKQMELDEITKMLKG